MAHHQLAQRHERKAQGSFCCCPRAGCRRTTAADPGQRSATSAWGGGLAHRRTQDVRREEILSRQPAGEDRPAHLSRHHQGTLDLRAASPAAERTTLSRSLRGAILARASPSRAYDNDRLRLPPAPPSRNSEAEVGPGGESLLSYLGIASHYFDIDHNLTNSWGTKRVYLFSRIVIFRKILKVV